MSIMIELLPAAGRALVIGGGAVASRKVEMLVAGGFEVDVVAPEVSEVIAALPGVSIERRAFAAEDVPGHAVVFACTDDRAANGAVGRASRSAGIPVVVADCQEESTCFTPAMHRDGGLLVGVSTGGASPRLATEARDVVAAALGPGWDQRAEHARRDRKKHLTSEVAQ